MRKLFLAAPLALAVALPAVAEISVNDKIGADEAEARAALVAAGYDVKAAEMEDGKLEFEAVKDGKEFEIYVDAMTGKVLEIELEDD